MAPMMLLLAAAIAAGPVPHARPRNPVAALVEARATVRIVAGVRVQFGSGNGRDGLGARDSVIRSAGGAEPARLIEFE
jgi:hypothetical protein